MPKPLLLALLELHPHLARPTAHMEYQERDRVRNLAPEAGRPAHNPEGEESGRVGRGLATSELAGACAGNNPGHNLHKGEENRELALGLPAPGYWKEWTSELVLHADAYSKRHPP